MPDAMIVLPRTSSDEEAHEVLLDALEERAEQALYLADELRAAPGVPNIEGSRLGRALRRQARMIERIIELEDEAIGSEELTTLLGAIQLGVDEAERMVLAADIRLAVDTSTFRQIEQSATAIGQLAMVGFAGYVGEVTDIAEFIAIEREAPVPLMHALQRVIAEGYVRGRRHDPVPTWLSSELGRTLGEFLEGYTFEDGRPVTMISPFIRVAAVACDRVAERWWQEVAQERGEAYAESRMSTLDATSETLELQRTRLSSLPNLGRYYDAGHAYALIEPLLEEHAHSQDFAPPRTMHAAHWFDLLMQSPADS
jgi:hypothetical protein